MEFVATQKFVRMSPRKLRFVADMVRKLKPVEAVEVLPQVNRRAGEPLSKVIKTAIANAKQKGISDADLELKEIQIEEGPQLKRGMPVSRGRWHPYIKRMSHIRVVLQTKSETETLSSKSQASTKVKKSKNRVTESKVSEVVDSVKKSKITNKKKMRKK